jgi:hypothetical protein
MASVILRQIHSSMVTDIRYVYFSAGGEVIMQRPKERPPGHAEMLIRSSSVNTLYIYTLFVVHLR